MKKRSVKIQGHATSVSLEEEFWDAFKAIAREQQRTANDLLAEIDRKRGRKNLSSAIRVYILKDYQSKLTPRQEHPE